MGCVQSNTATGKNVDDDNDNDSDKGETLFSSSSSPNNVNNINLTEESYAKLKEVALSQVRVEGLHLQFVSPKELQSDVDIVLAACRQNGLALSQASMYMRSNPAVVLTAIQQTKKAVRFMNLEQLRTNKDFFLTACRHVDGMLLRYASDELKADKEVVLTACDDNGLAIQYACDALQADKEVVLAAAATNSDALKYAKGCLSQDQDCLVAAELSGRSVRNKYVSRIVLSTRFSLVERNSGGSAETRRFGILLRECDYIRNGNFSVYSPNTFAKDSCDPEWTNFNWPCRGTFETCQMKNESLKRGVPQEGCCWRYAFRYQLKEARRTNGCMIQLVERAKTDPRNKNNNDGTNSSITTPQCLANGQQIEAAMAREVGTKVFRVHAPIYRKDGGDGNNDKICCDAQFTENHIGVVMSVLRGWYETKCSNKSDCLIQFVEDKWQSWDM